MGNTSTKPKKSTKSKKAKKVKKAMESKVPESKVVSIKKVTKFSELEKKIPNFYQIIDEYENCKTMKHLDKMDPHGIWKKAFILSISADMSLKPVEIVNQEYFDKFWEVCGEGEHMVNNFVDYVEEHDISLDEFANELFKRFSFESLKCFGI